MEIVRDPVTQLPFRRTEFGQYEGTESGQYPVSKIFCAANKSEQAGIARPILALELDYQSDY